MPLVSDETKQIYRDLKEALNIAVKSHKGMFAGSILLMGFRFVLKLLVPIVASIVVTKIQGRFDAKTLTGILIFWIIISGCFEAYVGSLLPEA